MQNERQRAYMTSKLYSALRVGTSMFHMRVGQLIDNAIAETGRDLFYINDNELADLINEYINKHNVRKDASGNQTRGYIKTEPGKSHGRPKHTTKKRKHK